MRRFPITLSACMLLFTTGALHTQTSPAPAAQRAPLPGTLLTHPDWPAAKNPADVDTVDHLMAALYDVISGPAGQQRDWDRFRSLFLPEGRLGVIRTEMPPAEGRVASRGDVAFLTPEQYIARQDSAFKANGFFERGIANRVDTFGNLTHVWSTYESRRTAADARPFARGINSVQIAHAQNRYWIVSLVWDSERPNLTIPEKYLVKP